MAKKAFLPLIGGLILCLVLLSACGTSGGSASASSAQKNTSSTTSVSSTHVATPAPTQAANPTPTTTTVMSTPTATGTSASCNPTYGCGTGSSNLTSYKGNGYTINFPGSWVIKSDGSNGTIFSAPDSSASFHVFVQNSSSVINPLQYEFGTLAKDNCKPVPSGLPTIVTNGVTWLQSQYVCQPADNGQAGGKVEEVGILVATGLHNATYYSMDYMTAPNNFDNADKIFFQPMTFSFKLA